MKSAMAMKSAEFHENPPNFMKYTGLDGHEIQLDFMKSVAMKSTGFHEIRPCQMSQGPIGPIFIFRIILAFTCNLLKAFLVMMVYITGRAITSLITFTSEMLAIVANVE